LAGSVELPALGVGLTYSSLLDPLIEQHPELVDVIEVEPQTHWIKTDDPEAPYRPDVATFTMLRDHPAAKLVHSVGAPVGGTVPPDPAQLGLLAQTAAELDVPWVSEHLGFNRTESFATGFFLPPRQTIAGVEVAAHTIGVLARAIGKPVAVETGVNYLRPRDDEIPDGEFVAQVVDATGCGILLDLHNLWCNNQNGRQTLDAFLSQIPLDSVWEVHLAGGMELAGYWLDAHSGVAPPQLIECAERIVPQLRNLKAIIFEILPTFITEVGLAAIRDQVQALHELWQLRGASSRPKAGPQPTARLDKPETGSGPTPIVWEKTLGGLVIGQALPGGTAEELLADPGVGILRTLVSEFRASMVASVLPLTSRHLLLTLGRTSFELLLQGFWLRHPPQMYGVREAAAFGDYLHGLDVKVPHLYEVLDFELAALATVVDGHTRVVTFEVEPIPLLRALADSQLPNADLAIGRFEIELTGDDDTVLGLRHLRDGPW
jgi:uncharacterized protein (UPF0276 family)